MSEIKIIVEAAEFVTAINNLANAINNLAANANTAENTTPAPAAKRGRKSTAAPTAEAAPVQPTETVQPAAPAPVVNQPVQQMQVPVQQPIPQPVQQMPVQPPVVNQPQITAMPQMMPTQAPVQQYQQPVPTATPTQQQAPAPAAPTYSTDDIGRAGAVLMSQGAQMQLNDLLTRFGVSSVNQLRPEQLAPFAAELRAMGAPI